ncbi:MAG TPA: SsrA-binding protein SmpB [Actinomycetota bacterium]|jgi:SsrA-binding protein|nr:SsrA-binding protein SmpB [Actinomycetota bacterium]
MPERTLAVNRRARHDYTIEETLEAGLVLTGTEIKSLRAGKASLAEAYARIEKGEGWLIGAHIAEWPGASRGNHEPRRPRKLLLHGSQIAQLAGKTQAKGLTLVPLRIYVTERGHAKIELGVGRGKKLYDRRREIAARDARRDLERAMAEGARGR